MLIREEERKHLLCLLIVVRLREFAGGERAAVGAGGRKKMPAAFAQTIGSRWNEHLTGFRSFARTRSPMKFSVDCFHGDPMSHGEKN